jgi:hypothetical protein
MTKCADKCNEQGSMRVPCFNGIGSYNRAIVAACLITFKVSGIIIMRILFCLELGLLILK